MPDSLVINDQKSLTKSLSDSQVIAPQLKNSPEGSGRGLFVEEMGASGASPGDRAWVLLQHKMDHPVGVEFGLGDESVEAEEVVEHDKLVTFTVPTLPWESNAITLDLSSGNSHIKVPFKYRKRCRSMTPAVSVENLVEFATNGDTLALVKPFSFLISQVDVEGNTVLHLAARNSQSFALKVLLSAVPAPDKEEIINMRNFRGQTALHCAIRSGDPDSVHYLMANSAKTDIADNHKNTAVHYLADAYNEAIFKEILERTSSEDLHIDLLNDEGLSPLHLAVRRLKLSLIDMILEVGASVDGRDKNGRTALMHAVAMNDPEIVQYFAERDDCDKNVEDESGETALSLAKQNANYALIGLLIDTGADPKQKNKNDEALEDTDDDMIIKILQGERIALPPKEAGSCSPSDLVMSRLALFGNSVVKRNGNHNHKPVLVRLPDDQDDASEEELNQTKEVVDKQRQSVARLAEEVEEFLLDVDQPSTSRASTSSHHRTTTSYNKDDISCLDYLTRLRLSKILDNETRWQMLAKELGCEHMIELICICTDEESSPTMILLDQFEQLPEAQISRVRHALEALQYSEAVALIDERYVY